MAEPEVKPETKPEEEKKPEQGKKPGKKAAVPSPEDEELEKLKHLDIAKDQLKMLKQIFDSFDLEKKGEINVDMIGQILDMLGQQLSGEELQAIVGEIDEDGNGVMSFEEFAHLAARFLVEEDEDVEAILRELKDAFRLYDKNGLGYISVDLLREILRELDEKLTPKDLEQMIEEIDTDGSGTVDWEEFKAMMIG